MHRWGGDVYTLGGGATYLETYGGRLSEPHECLVGRTFDAACSHRLTLLERGQIDYHLVCSPSDRAEVGDSAIYALHPQYYVNRAYVAVASGVASGRPRLEGLFDSAGNALDDQFRPIPADSVIERIDRYLVGQSVLA
jgi:hypothetical protein